MKGVNLNHSSSLFSPLACWWPVRLFGVALADTLFCCSKVVPEISAVEDLQSTPDDAENVRTVELNRLPNSGLGISIVGGKSPRGLMGIFIRHVLETSPAGRLGTLKTGDQILEARMHWTPDLSTKSWSGWWNAVGKADELRVERSPFVRAGVVPHGVPSLWATSGPGSSKPRINGILPLDLLADKPHGCDHTNQKACPGSKHVDWGRRILSESDSFYGVKKAWSFDLIQD